MVREETRKMEVKNMRQKVRIERHTKRGEAEDKKAKQRNNHRDERKEGIKKECSFPRAGICLLEAAPLCPVAPRRASTMIYCFVLMQMKAGVFFSKRLPTPLQAAAPERSLPAITSNSQPQVADSLLKQHCLRKPCVCVCMLCVFFFWGRSLVYLAPPPHTHTHRIKVRS